MESHLNDVHSQTVKDIYQRINTIVSSNCPYSKKIEDYTLLRKIGKGTFGIVYRAKCKQTQEIVAIKAMSISHLEKKRCLLRAINEIELQYAVSNSERPMQHIVSLLTAFAIKDYIYMILEYCNFDTLDTYLKFRFVFFYFNNIVNQSYITFFQCCHVFFFHN